MSGRLTASRKADGNPNGQDFKDQKSNSGLCNWRPASLSAGQSGATRPTHQTFGGRFHTHERFKPVEVIKDVCTPHDAILESVVHSMSSITEHRCIHALEIG